MRLYTDHSLEGINIKKVIDMINRQNRCKIQSLLQLTTLSNELYYYLYTQDIGLTCKEKKAVSKLIDERKEELDNLLVEEMYSPVKKYFNDNFKWIIILFFMFSLVLLVRLYFNEQSCSLLNIIIFEIIYLLIAFLIVIGIDVIVWKADMSISMKPGWLLLFFEKKYYEYGFIKSFFDYYRNSK